MSATTTTYTKKYHLTDQGIRALREKLADLRQRRRQITEDIIDLSSQSTFLSTVEDSAFAQNRVQATDLENRIADLEHVIQSADIITEPETCDCVELGSRVTVEVGGKARTYHIVSPLEADPLEGRVSDESPFGLSLLGKKQGDQVAVQGPHSGAVQAKILSIG